MVTWHRPGLVSYASEIRRRKAFACKVQGTESLGQAAKLGGEKEGMILQGRSLHLWPKPSIDDRHDRHARRPRPSGRIRTARYWCEQVLVVVVVVVVVVVAVAVVKVLLQARARPLFTTGFDCDTTTND